MGVAGAAFATIFAQLISAILCYVYTFIKYPYLRFKKEDIKIDIKSYLNHLKLGLPLGFQFSILAIGLIVLQSTIIKFDTTIDGIIIDQGPAQLAYGAYSKLQNFFMCPLSALGTAMLSFVGQNYGAKNQRRIGKGMTASFVIMFILCIFLVGLMFLLMIDNTFLKIFYPVENINEDVINLSRINIVATFPFFPFLGCIFILRCAIQGVEKSYISLIAGIGELVARILICVYAPYIFTSVISNQIVSNILNNHWPYAIVCMADPIAWVCADICLGVGCFIYINLPYKKYLKSEKITQN